MPRKQEERKSDRLGAITALALFLFMPPVIMLPSGTMIDEWPGLFLWVFMGWGVVIALLAWAINSRRGPPA